MVHRSRADRLGRAAALLATLVGPVAVVGVLRAWPALPLASAPPWLLAGVGVTAAGLLGMASVALVIRGVLDGRWGPLLGASALAALAGGAVAELVGRPVFAGTAAVGAALLLFAVVAERSARGLAAPSARWVAGIAGFTLVEAAVAVLVLVDPLRGTAEAPITAVAAGVTLLAAAASTGSLPRRGTILLAGGLLALAVARPESAELLVARAAIGGAGFAVALRLARGDPGVAAVPEPTTPMRLPAFAAALADACLLFDDRLLLRDWNASAAALLRLGPGADGTRLDTLFGRDAGRHARRGASIEVDRDPASGDRLEVTLVPRPEGLVAVARAIAQPLAPDAESDGLRRELRGTIEDLILARRTVALQRAELEQAATLDPLTGALSRRALLARLAAEVAEAERYAHPVAVVMADVDDLREINDRHGPEVGDAVLREVALRMRVRIRAADALGRVDGGAFLAVLPHGDDAGAATFASALVERVARRPIATADGELTVTLSVGVAVLRAGERLGPDALLGRVEEALDSARRGGGNRVAFDRLHGFARIDGHREAGPRIGPETVVDDTR